MSRIAICWLISSGRKSPPRQQIRYSRVQTWFHVLSSTTKTCVFFLSSKSLSSSAAVAATGIGGVAFFRKFEWLVLLVLCLLVKSIGDSGGVETPQSDDRHDTDTSDCNRSGRLLIPVNCGAQPLRY